jgi:hypothetical protein
VRDNQPAARATHWVRHSRGTPAPVSMRVRPTRTTGLPLRRPPKLDLARRPSSSEFLCALVVLAPFGNELAYQGFGPPRGTTVSRPPLQGHPKPPLRSVLRLSQPLDGLLRETSHRLVSSGSHVQGSHPFRGFSPRAAFLPSSGRAAPLSFPAPVLAGSETGCRPNAPRLRGLSPHEVALSPGLVSPAPRPAPLFEFPFPPGVRFPPCPPVTRVAPLMTFVLRDLRLPADLAGPPSASLDGDPGSRHLCPGQPARNFRAFLWFRYRSSSPG